MKTRTVKASEVKPGDLTQVSPTEAWAVASVGDVRGRVVLRWDGHGHCVVFPDSPVKVVVSNV